MWRHLSRDKIQTDSVRVMWVRHFRGCEKEKTTAVLVMEGTQRVRSALEEAKHPCAHADENLAMCF